MVPQLDNVPTAVDASTSLDFNVSKLVDVDVTPVLFTCPDRASLRFSEDEEPLLMENEHRWVMFPIEYHSLYWYYKRIASHFWTPAMTNWSAETVNNKISDKTKGMLTIKVMTDLLCQYGFSGPMKGSAANCGLRPLDMMSGIGVNSRELFLEDTFPDLADVTQHMTAVLQTPEARAFLGFQTVSEGFHRDVFVRAICYILNQVDNDKKISSACFTDRGNVVTSGGVSGQTSAAMPNPDPEPKMLNPAFDTAIVSMLQYSILGVSAPVAQLGTVDQDSTAYEWNTPMVRKHLRMSHHLSGFVAQYHTMTFVGDDKDAVESVRREILDEHRDVELSLAKRPTNGPDGYEHMQHNMQNSAERDGSMSNTAKQSSINQTLQPTTSVASNAPQSPTSPKRSPSRGSNMIRAFSSAFDGAPIQEVLVGMSIMKCMAYSSIGLLYQLCLKNNAETCPILFSTLKIFKDNLLMSDFYAHISENLKNKCAKDIISKMILECARMEYEYLVSLFCKNGKTLSDVYNVSLSIIDEAGDENETPEMARVVSALESGSDIPQFTEGEILAYVNALIHHLATSFNINTGSSGSIGSFELRIDGVTGGTKSPVAVPLPVMPTTEEWYVENKDAKYVLDNVDALPDPSKQFRIDEDF